MKKIVVKSLLLVCVYVLLWSNVLQAQMGNFVTYGIEDGLAMSQIETIIQDDQGFLWVGTIAGLSKYDGYSFENYTQKDGLAEDWITCAFKDDQGNLWFGHWGGGVTKYDIASKQFTDLKIEKYSNFKYITDIAQDQQGKIWFSTDGAGIFYVNQKEMSPSYFKANLSSKQVTAMCFESSGKLLLGSKNGIEVIDVAQNQKEAKKLNGLSVGRVTDIIEAFNNELWVATNQSGITKLKYSSDFSKIDQNALNMASGLPSNNIKCLLKDKDKNIWIGSKDQGVVQFVSSNFNQGEFSKGSLNVFSNKFEMKYYHANCFAQDYEGNIWIGTEIGLNKYMGELFRVYNHNEKLVNNLVWSIVQDDRKRMWFGTTGGISVFSFPTIAGTKQYNNPQVKNITTANGLSENIIISLLQSKNRNIWAGTENSGLNILNPEGMVVKKISTANGLSGNKIFSLAQDKDGFVWVGTRNGVSKIDPNTYAIKNYNKENDGIGADKIYKIFKDSKDNLWFAALGGALTKFDGKSFRTYDAADGLEQEFILSITEDAQSNLWFGTYGDGIIKYDRNTFTTYNMQDGMSSNSTHFITVDKDNKLWIGQSLGIEQFDAEQKAFSLFGKKQGFNGLETNENAVYVDDQGNIWFGTLKGVVKFAPRKNKKNEIEPQTYVENVKIFFNDTILTDGQKLSYDQNYLTFDVLGISLTNSSEVKYAYKLDGFDQDWSPPTKDRSITYSNLAPGSYTFMVKASNNSGIENQQASSLSFTISPPWWKTWWFYLICAVLAVLALISFIKLREKQLKQRQAELESEVKRQTEEIRKEKEIVERQNKNIVESISYAKKIQQAILPPIEEVKKALPESFIMYKPKDIVSGDFYWVHKLKDKTLFAAVDCTGHGVPGAFMSIIGHNLLDKVVKEHKQYEPAKILDLLSKELATTLRQDADKSSIKDGMDLSICAIDHKSKKLEYAGAYNPLYIARDKKIQEVKSDKISIGKGGSPKKGSFNNQLIELEKGDMIYLFSDGYADQKGGPKNKKFYYPPFRDLLSEISDLPVDKQQKNLEDTIEQWKKGNEQYDDMLVFGVKV